MTLLSFQQVRSSLMMNNQSSSQAWNGICGTVFIFAQIRARFYKYQVVTLHLLNSHLK